MADVGVSNGNNGDVSVEVGVGVGVMTEVKETTPPIVNDSAAMDSASGSTEQLPIVSAPVPVLTEAAEAAIAVESAKAVEPAESLKALEAVITTESATVTKPVESAKTTEPMKVTEATEFVKSAESVEAEESVEAVHSAKPMESSEVSESLKAPEPAPTPVPTPVPTSEPDPQPVGRTECSTKENALADEKLPVKDPDTQDASAIGKSGNSWMAELALDLEVAPDSKRGSIGAESEDDPEVVVVVPEMAVVGVGVSKSDDGGSVSGIGSVARELSPTVLKKREENIRAEMDAFLEDSEAENDEEAVPDKGKGVDEEGGKGKDGSGDSASASAADLPSPSVDAPPRSPTDDTEFSAQHARRVIGSGVVHERKASISAGPVPELKNKSQFSAEDAAATISAGAISERARKLREEQEALKRKHATERQDTDFIEIPTMSKAGSVRGKADMYHQALGGGGSEKAAKPAPVSGRLRGDWTQRRESLEQFVVKYEAPEKPSATTATGAADAPTRYIPLPAEGATSHPTKIRCSTSGSSSTGAPSQPQGNAMSSPTSSLTATAGETAAAGAGEAGDCKSESVSEVSVKVESDQEEEGRGKGTGDAKEDVRNETAKMEGSELGGEHSGEVAVVTSVASPSPASASPASASASAATIITNSTNITISNIRGGDIAAATEGGADGEVLKGANGAEMMTAFSEVGAGRTARTEKKAVGDTSTTDAGSVALPTSNGEVKAVGVSEAVPAPAPVQTESQSDTGGCCNIS